MPLRPHPLHEDLLHPIGGRLRVFPEDFCVSEIPAYPPSGDGDHLLIHLEKRSLTTPALVECLARALDIPSVDVGVAGYKDRHALTRQWVSVRGVPQEAALSLEIPGVQVLEVSRHHQRLRRGHLRGNRFRITVRDVPPLALDAARHVLSGLESKGLPNAYGPQRFGATGQNHAQGRALIQGDAPAFLHLLSTPDVAHETPRVIDARHALAERRWKDARALFPPQHPLERHLAKLLDQRGAEALPAAVRTLPRRARDFLLSAWQSACFNKVLAARLSRGIDLWPGDLAMKHDNGACFRVEDLETTKPRFTRGEISPTGPLPGFKMTHPMGEALTLESEITASEGFSRSRPSDLFARRHLPGARRALLVPFRDGIAELSPEGHLVLSFTLPAGAYATVVLAHLALTDDSPSDAE